jgi:hypothetical protein
MDMDELAQTPRKRSNSIDTEREENKSSASKADSKQRTKETAKSNTMNPMKTFRVNQDDPCWKVLPAAMRKYQVNGREEDYRLFITYDNNGGIPFIAGVTKSARRENWIYLRNHSLYSNSTRMKGRIHFLCYDIMDDDDMVRLTIVKRWQRRMTSVVLALDLRMGIVWGNQRR